jgi:hypothetical protein
MRRLAPVRALTAVFATLLAAAPGALSQAPGTVKAEAKISSTSGNFGGDLVYLDQFGLGVTAIGDLDGDGVTELAVGAPGEDDGPNGPDSGGVWILFMNTDGTVKSQSKISHTGGDLGLDLPGDAWFGYGVERLDDFDGDGVFDLAVGAAGNSDGGNKNGALHLVLLNADATVKQVHTISELEGGFDTTLDIADSFANTIANLGDLDGDGITELAVTHIYDDDTAFNSGAFWIFWLESDGTLKDKRKIGSADLAEPLDANDEFGRDVAVVGDLDGDGIAELAVGAYGDQDGANAAGAVWILFMAADGSVRQSTKISQTQGGFGAVLGTEARFGSAVEPVGDLDGDGTPDLAVGASRGPFYQVGSPRVFVLFLEPDGSVREHVEISEGLGGLTATLENGDLFGESLANLGDLDGDGVIDLAVGANGDDDGGAERGAVHVLFLNGAKTAPWTPLHPGLAGGDGVPTLVVDASLKPASLGEIRITGGAANAPTILAIGRDGLGEPFKGGVLYPDPLHVVNGLLLDGQGALSLPFLWPASLMSGLDVWAQAWIVDGVGPFGLAATNGVVGVAP